MDDHFEILEEPGNPLDCVEDILAGQEWTYDRLNEDELTVVVSGRGGHYRIVFLWDEQTSLMEFSCEYDLSIPKTQIDTIAHTIMAINKRLKIGHFSLHSNGRTPIFRHNALYRGYLPMSATDHIQNLLEMALQTCENYYSTFEILAAPQPVNDAMLSLALMETAGAA